MSGKEESQTTSIVPQIEMTYLIQPERNYNAEPEKKRASQRENYRAEPEKKLTSRRTRYRDAISRGGGGGGGGERVLSASGPIQNAFVWFQSHWGDK